MARQRQQAAAIEGQAAVRDQLVGDGEAPDRSWRVRAADADWYASHDPRPAPQLERARREIGVEGVRRAPHAWLVALRVHPSDAVVAEYGRDDAQPVPAPLG